MKLEIVVYEHAARLIDRNPWDVSRDLDLLVEAHTEAYRRYAPSVIVPGIDVYNLEAEAYGASVECPNDNDVPSIPHPLLDTCDAVLDLPPMSPSGDGRLQMTLAAATELKRRLPGVPVKVPVSGPFSLLSILIGFENLLCETMTATAGVAAALSHLARGQQAYARAAQSLGLDITIFESAAAPPLLSPDLFHSLVLPPLSRLISEATRSRQRPACIIGGNTLPILSDLLALGSDFIICPAETDQPAFLKAIPDAFKGTVRVNMRPAVFTSGDSEAMHAEADRVAALTRQTACASIGTGILPYEADPADVLNVRDYLADR